MVQKWYLLAMAWCNSAWPWEPWVSALKIQNADQPMPLFSLCTTSICTRRGEGVGQIGFLNKLWLLPHTRAFTLSVTCPLLAILLVVVGKDLILAAGSSLECFVVTRSLGPVRVAALQSKGHGAESNVVAWSCDTAVFCSALSLQR